MPRAPAAAAADALRHLRGTAFARSSRAPDALLLAALPLPRRRAPRTAPASQPAAALPRGAAAAIRGQAAALLLQALRAARRARSAGAAQARRLALVAVVALRH